MIAMVARTPFYRAHVLSSLASSGAVSVFGLECAGRTLPPGRPPTSRSIELSAEDRFRTQLPSCTLPDIVQNA